MSINSESVQYQRGWRLADSYIKQGFDISSGCPTKNEEFLRGFNDRVNLPSEETQVKTGT